MARIPILMLVAAGLIAQLAGASQHQSNAEIARASGLLLEKRVPVTDGPGAVLLVARASDVIYKAARGRANVELEVPLTPDHVFRIASITKIFTSALVLTLAERGLLSLDDPLEQYLPGFPSGDAIKIRQLLDHTAGISDVVRDPQPGFSRRDVSSDIRVDEIRKRPLDFQPGTKWAYSNSGYILLGAIVERVTGEPWHVALEKLLLQPLGLRRTGFGDGSALIAGRVAGYTRDRLLIRNAPFISMTIPDSAGALVSTADELRTWITALMRGRVVGRASLLEMTSPASPADAASPSYKYGFGVYIWKVRGATMIGHTGQINGFAAALGYLPERDVTIVVLANDDTFDARVVGRRLAAIALGEPYPEVSAVTPSSPLLAEMEGRYTLDAQTIVTLIVKDGTLWWQRGDRRPLPMQMTSRESFHFVPDELTYITPVRRAGRVVALDYFPDGEAPPSRLPRIGQ